MADENTENTGAPTDEIKSFSQSDVDKMVEEATSGLKAKVDQLLGETKQAKEKAKQQADAAAKEAEERARQENDYKSLFESSQNKAKDFEQKYNELNQSIMNEKIGNQALSIAGELADGNNAKILSTFIKDRITVKDGKTIVKDESGNPTVATVDDLKKEFVNSGMYDSLLRQSKATGGGAANSQSGAATASDLTKMSRSEKLAYFKQKREAS